jgi:hypothetical protein
MKKSYLDTRIHLVAELEKVPQTPLIAQIIAEAEAGEFHDYKNKKYNCGKVAAVGLLRQAGLEELAKRVMNGDFDETADEEDKANLRLFAPKNMWGLLGLDEKTH